MWDRLTRRAALAGAMAMGGAAAYAGDRPLGRAFAGRSTVIAQGGMVATSQPLATQAALQILRAGGSAVDAAIAANACLGLMEPVGCGIGGDLFAQVWDPAKSELVGVDASGPAPQSRTLDELRIAVRGQKTIPFWGTPAVTVPGAVDGWLTLHARFGKLRLADVLAPAIGYARDGFPVSPVIAQAWARNVQRFRENAAAIGPVENALALYAPGGETPKAGQIFRNRDLANTYTNIAVFGRAAFYEGAVAERLDAYMRKIGGPLRFRDMTRYRAKVVTPISAAYRGVEVWQMPPPGQGLTVLQMLRILDGFDIAAMGFGSADALHVMVEAKKIAFQDRARYIADPDFARVPVEQLLSEPYVQSQRDRIRMDAAGPAAGPAPLERGDTIYLACADASGMMVSLIQSNYRGMGGGLVPDGLGFMLQNRGSQFSLDPKSPNAFAPGKRPFHTIIPGFATKGGKPWLAFGVMGGAMQPQGHTQIVSNLVDFGMDLQEAGDAPRWRHIGGPDPDGGTGGEAGDALYLETGFGAEPRHALAARGHTLREGVYEDVGGYQAVMTENGVLHGASEMRKDGQAAGF